MERGRCVGTEPRWGRNLPRKINPTTLGLLAGGRAAVKTRPSEWEET
jgi:hypothetical protein